MNRLSRFLCVLLLGVAPGWAEECPPLAPDLLLPHQALAIAPGACVSGTREGRGPAQLVRFEVPEASAQTWRLEVTGTAGAGTLVGFYRVLGELKPGTKPRLVTVGAVRADATGHASLETWLSPGLYLGAIGSERPVDYTAHLRTSPVDGEAGAATGEFQRVGEVDRRGQAKFTWTLDEAQAAQVWDLEVEAAWQPRPQARSLTVFDSRRKRPVSLRVRGGFPRVHRLQLAPGANEVVLAGFGPGGYRVTARPAGRPEAGRETEPNSLATQAQALTLDRPLRGTLDLGDQDFYSFRLGPDAPARRWRIEGQVRSGSPVRVSLRRDGNSEELQVRTGSRVSLSDLALEPGAYVVEVRGEGRADYRLSVRPERGRPRPHQEREPNDRPRQASALSPGRFATGRFTGKDVDVYSFETGSAIQLWRVQAVGSGLSGLELLGADDGVKASVPGAAGARLVRLPNLYLLPGVHRIVVRGDSGSYSLRVLPLGPPRPGAEREPNDTEGTGEELRLDQDYFGLLESQDDRDVYRFYLPARQEVQLTAAPPPEGSLKAYLRWGSGPRSKELVGLKPAARDPLGTPLSLRRVLDPGEYSLELRPTVPCDGEYRLRLARGRPFRADPLRAPETWSCTLAPLPHVAPALPWRQEVRAALRCRNQGTESVSLTLEVESDDRRWRPRLPTDAVTLSPGETRELALPVAVAPEAWVRNPARLAVRVKAADAGLVLTAALGAADGARPQSPTRAPPLPAELLGGPVLSWSALGARIEKPVPRFSPKLLDRYVSAGDGFILSGARRPFVIRLAPEAATRVAGFLVHPLSSAPPPVRVRELALDVSVDGQTFREVWKGELSATPEEQAIVLAEPVAARFVRVRFLSNFGGPGYSLGDLGVIGVPGQTPPELSGRNLAAPHLGGHVVRSHPPLGKHWDRGILTEADDLPTTYPTSDGRLEWVLGFYNQRAARIRRLEWVSGPPNRSPPLREVQVDVSRESPLGPWEPLETWSLPATPATTTALDLPRPRWARYLRFRAEGIAKGQRPQVPRTLRVLEEPEDEDYLSALGAWGHARREGFYETTRADRSAGPSSGPGRAVPAGTRRDAPFDLDTPGPRQAHGEVSRGKRSDWMKVTAPPETDTLRLEVTGRGAFRPGAAVLDAAGEIVACEEDDPEPGPDVGVVLTCPVAGGSPAWIRIEEPPRSVVISWDSSASVAPFRASIWRALTRFSAGLAPGREEANLLPFGAKKPLLEEWARTPLDLQRALAAYPHRDSSSAAEATLAYAAELLAPRPGRRSILLITDAETLRHPPLWGALEASRPEVYSLDVNWGPAPASGPMIPRNLHQTWAGAAGGRYEFMKSQAQLDRAFDAAVRRLRRPLVYSAAWEFVRAEPLPPATLEVMAAPEQAPGAGGLEIILDASGSMYKKLEGRPRFQLAHEVLGQLLREDLEAGMPVALRAFGHREERSCRTDLEVPLGPLDPSSFLAKVQAIVPQAYSKTPLAASLAAAASDLRGATGPKVLILVTDGEETCDGDPEAEIAKLRAGGLDVTVNIVGFAIQGDRAKEAFRSWSEAGGGRYFDAQDSAALGDALARATRRPFDVLDAGGARVAGGEVGGAPLELPPGRYRLRFPGQPEWGREVILPPGKRTRVALKNQ